MLRQVLVLLALFLCLSFVQAQDKKNVQATVTSADFVVTTSVDQSGLPYWQYNTKDNATFVYQVSFVGAWEYENTTDYDVVAGSAKRQFNTVVNKYGGVVNNSQVVSVNLAGESGLTVNFTTHVPLNSVGNETSYPTAKFDVIINKYKWTSLDSDAQLVLAFKVDYHSSANSDVYAANLSTHGSRTVNFGDGYFSVNATAKSGSSASNLTQTIGVAVKRALDVGTDHIPSTIPYSSALVYILYDNFNVEGSDSSYLSHDPEFGFGKGPGNDYFWIIIVVAVVVAIIVIILIAVIGFILVRRRRRSYDAF